MTSWDPAISGQSQSWQRRQYSNKAGIYPSSSSSKIAVLHGARCRVRRGEQCHGLAVPCRQQHEAYPKSSNAQRLKQRKSYQGLPVSSALGIYLFFLLMQRTRHLLIKPIAKDSMQAQGQLMHCDKSSATPSSVHCSVSAPNPLLTAERKTNAANSLVCSTLCFELFTATPIGRKKHFSLGHNEEHISST